MSPPPGQFLLLLHGHLPFVRRPDHTRFLEEDWLFEAISECYLPLLSACQRLAAEGVRYRLTVGLSPTLLSMLADDLLCQRYLRHLDDMVSLCRRERRRTRRDGRLHALAGMYEARYTDARTRFLRGEDLLAAFAALEDQGLVELVTCAATHAYLPLLGAHPQAVRAQIRVAVECHRRLLGRSPRGIWLPECGYVPGLEEFLAAEGLGYTFLENHGLLGATPRPAYGVYAPARCPNGMAVFGRDPHSSRIVWSATEGYPGHPVYRDFYRDIGHELDRSQLGPFVQATGERKPLGIKYHRITGRDREQALYDPEAAAAQVEIHARDFAERQVARLALLQGRMGGRRPLIVAPFDAELFGHWWFEGPQFLESVLRQLAARPDRIVAASPSEVLSQQAAEAQILQPAASSWGQGGYNQVWLNRSNDWMVAPLHAATAELIRQAEAAPAPGELVRRSLNQAARELMLAQASDWPFMISTGNAADFARARFEAHVRHVNGLISGVRTGRLDLALLTRLEDRNNLFPHLDYRLFVRRAAARPGLTQ